MIGDVAEFAGFDEHGAQEPWRDIAIRPFESGDAKECADLLAARQSWPPERALEAVRDWGDDQLRHVLVAERRGRVEAYGKTEFLSPNEQGGRAPTGWYLAGVVVAPEARRHGIGLTLTRERIRSLRGVASEVWYFVNAQNRASVAMHERLGFILHTKAFTIPGVTFRDGAGGLYRLPLG
jgi:ribosomal protein S18 acetylase RimI-like enzyme